MRCFRAYWDCERILLRDNWARLALLLLPVLALSFLLPGGGDARLFAAFSALLGGLYALRCAAFAFEESMDFTVFAPLRVGLRFYAAKAVLPLLFALLAFALFHGLALARGASFVGWAALLAGAAPLFAAVPAAVVGFTLVNMAFFGRPLCTVCAACVLPISAACAACSAWAALVLLAVLLLCSGALLRRKYRAPVCWRGGGHAGL